MKRTGAAFSFRRLFMMYRDAFKVRDAGTRTGEEARCLVHWFKNLFPSAPVLLVAIAATAAPQPGRTRPPRGSSIQFFLDRLAHRYVADPCHVGISIAARIKDRTYFANAGVVERGRATPPTPDTIYELASVTKTFVGALAAAALVDHRFALDADFRVHLHGEFPNLARSGLPITLRTLATHTSGLQRDLPDSDALLAAPDYDSIAGQFATLNKGYTRETDLSALHSVELRSTPGTTFAYSNLGMRVLGYGLEEAYHQSLKHLLGRLIFKPLGMRSTAFIVAPADRPRLATPYNRNHMVQAFHDESAGAGYGLYSTTRDMGRYLAWQLDQTNPVVQRAHRLIRGSNQDGEALIWNVTQDKGEAMLWHGGGSFGETSQVVLFPGSQQGYALLANDACPGSEDALKRSAVDLRRALQDAQR